MQRLSQVVLNVAMRHMHHLDFPLMPLPHRLAQNAPQRRKPSTRSQQPERSSLPVRVVMQRSTPELPQAHRVANLEPAGLAAKSTGPLAVDMKFKEVVFTRQACQGIGPRYRPAPQHHMLARLISHCALWAQAQAQHVTEPVQCANLCGNAILLRVEHRHTQVTHYPALASQSPALGVFLQRQCLGQGVRWQPVQAMHQAGMAATGAATVGHIQPGLVQGIEQVAAGRHRPAALAHANFGHCQLSLLALYLAGAALRPNRRQASSHRSVQAAWRRLGCKPAPIKHPISSARQQEQCLPAADHGPDRPKVCPAQMRAILPRLFPPA